MRRLAFVLCVLVLAACGPNGSRDDDDDDDTVDAAVTPDALEPFDGDIYAHSFQHLYKVDPDSYQVTLIGSFGWPVGSENEMMTDIAVDKDGKITGISFGAIYAVDEHTAACTYLAPLTGQSFNGLTWLPQGNDPEILVGTGLSGTLWQLDPTGVADPVQIGAYGGQMVSSGDIVSVEGFGTVATVKNGSELDYLARIDDATGTGVIIGPTGYADIWGVGYWRNKVFGFVATNQLVVIDVTTGVATYISTGPENWAGAGVTTRAPIIPL